MVVALANSYAGIMKAFSFAYMRDHHNIYFFRGKPLTEEEKTYLKQFYPARLVDGVRVVEEVASSGAFIHTARRDDLWQQPDRLQQAQGAASNTEVAQA